MSNVIQFPQKDTLVRLEQGSGLADDECEDSYKYRVDLYMDLLVGSMIESFEGDDIDFQNVEYVKYTAMAIECLRAALYSQKELPHPLCGVMDQVIVHIETHCASIKELV
jgi:hypothetical protein